jgi:hypothetical protein
VRPGFDGVKRPIEAAIRMTGYDNGLCATVFLNCVSIASKYRRASYVLGYRANLSG